MNSITYIVGFTEKEIKLTIQILKYYENEYLTYGEETHLGNLIKKLENKLK